MFGEDNNVYKIEDGIEKNWIKITNWSEKDDFKIRDKVLMFDNFFVCYGEKSIFIAKFDLNKLYSQTNDDI